jgi:hypothetical protein
MSHSIFSDHTGYGYREVPVDSNTWQVMFDGNSATDTEVVDRYALYRAAELTTENGYDYFIVLGRQAEVSTSMTGPPEIHTNVQPYQDPVNGASGIVTSTTSSRMVFPHTTRFTMKTIRMFQGKKPDSNAAAYDAKSMVAMMAPNIKRGD